MIVNYSDSGSDSEVEIPLWTEGRLFKREILPRKLSDVAEAKKNYLKITKPEAERVDEIKPKIFDPTKKTGFLSSLPDPINKNHPIKSSRLTPLNITPKTSAPKFIGSDQANMPTSKPDDIVVSISETAETQESAIPIEKSEDIQEVDLQDVIRKIGGGKRNKLTPNDVEMIDLTDSDIIGDTSALFRGRTEGSTQLFQNINIEKPTGTERTKHQINYLAYQAQQQEMHNSQIWDYKPKKRTNREKYGF